MSTDFYEHRISFDRCIELKELRADIKWAGKLPHGGALHIIVEDGNISDGNIKFCIDRIESGDYGATLKEDKRTAGEIKDRDIERQLKIAKALLELDVFTREMVNNGSTMTGKLFDHIFNNEA